MQQLHYQYRMFTLAPTLSAAKTHTIDHTPARTGALWHTGVDAADLARQLRPVRMRGSEPCRGWCSVGFLLSQQFHVLCLTPLQLFSFILRLFPTDTFRPRGPHAVHVWTGPSSIRRDCDRHCSSVVYNSFLRGRDVEISPHPVTLLLAL